MEQTLPLEREVRNVFSKFPDFPENITELLVTLAPWLALIGAILGIFAFISLVGLGSVISVATIGINSYGSTYAMWVGIISVAISAVLYLLAFQPLRQRSVRGWNLLYYAFLFNLAMSLLALNLLGLIITFLLGGWVLYQMRPKYN